MVSLNLYAVNAQTEDSALANPQTEGQKHARRSQRFAVTSRRKWDQILDENGL
jgi:hypothetical protein